MNKDFAVSQNLLMPITGAPAVTLEEWYPKVFAKEYIQLVKKIVPTQQTVKSLQPFVG